MGPAPRRMRFGIDDLRQVRRVTAQWAARACLSPERAEDLVIAVNEIATTAVRHRSPVTRLHPQIMRGTVAQAEVRDTRHWPPGPAGEAAFYRPGKGR